MAFNTAVFYDIENLLNGYSLSQKTPANLSLTEILTAIRQTQRLGKVALQRAYANWSDHRLGIMREEINQLGIDPIQVFGFARDQKKNDADIQLAIDATDLVHARPALEVFVIVSGDGGFAALAKKLHEHGKTVIGSAYPNTASRTFQAVCDEFVFIKDPEQEERQESPSTMAVKGDQLEVTELREVRMTSHVNKLLNFTPSDALAKTQEVLRWFAADAECRTELAQNGIHLSVIDKAIKYAVPDFQAKKFGFAKLSKYLQFACKDTEICLVRSSIPHPAVYLRLRSRPSADLEVLPDLEMRERHSLENYRSLLATGSPRLKLPNLDAARRTAVWTAQYPLSQADIGSRMEEASAVLDDSVPLGDVKQSILCFVSAGVFERVPEGVPLSEQKLTLKSDMQSPDVIEVLMIYYAGLIIAICTMTRRAKSITATALISLMILTMGISCALQPDDPGYDRERFGQTSDQSKIRIIRRMTLPDGRVLDVYSGRPISRSDVEVDHIVPLSVAWRRGMASRSYQARVQFANDVRNLIPTSKSTNRAKGGHGILGWIPPLNRCEYTKQYLRVLDRYNLSILPEEKALAMSICKR